jgi:hypothetical protein
VRTASTALFLLICAAATNGTAAQQERVPPYARPVTETPAPTLPPYAYPVTPNDLGLVPVTTPAPTGTTDLDLLAGLAVAGLAICLAFFLLVKIYLSRSHRAAVVITVLLLIGTWTYPPWIEAGRGYSAHREFNFLFDPNSSMRIDVARLVLIDIIIVTAGALFVWAILTARPRLPTKRAEKDDPLGLNKP